MNQGRPAIDLNTEIFNPSNIPLNISDINLNVSIQGNNIGTIIPQRRYTIPPRKTGRIILPLDLTGGGTALITSLMQISNAGGGIRVAGSYNAQGISMNVNTEVRP